MSTETERTELARKLARQLAAGEIDRAQFDAKVAAAAKKSLTPDDPATPDSADEDFDNALIAVRSLM